MERMKKLFALFMIFVLTLGLVPVNAEGENEVNKIEEKWSVDYKLEGYEIDVEDLAGAEDGIYAVGYFYQVEEVEIEDDTEGDVNGLEQLEEEERAAFIIKYDNNGNILWEKTYREGNNYFTGVATVSDGVVVLAEDWTSETVSIFKYNKAGELVSKKTILNDYIIENYEYLNMESYNDDVVVSFDNYLFTYNVTTGEVKTKVFNEGLTNAEDSVVISDINENGVYAGYYNATSTSATLVRYNYDLTGEVISEYKVLSAIVTALSVIDGNVVVGITDTTNAAKLVVLDKDLKLVKEESYDAITYFFDFAETRDGFAAITGREIVVEEPLDPVEPTDGSGLEVKKSHDVKAVSSESFFGIKYFDNNLKEYLTATNFNYYSYRLENVSGGIAYVQDARGEDSVYYLKLNKLGYEEYTYEVKQDENGEVVVTKNDNGNWQVTVTPKEGYQVTKVIVTNSEGTIEYANTEFEIPMDNVEIEVVYELIPANPNTGLSNPYIIFGAILVVGVVGYSFLKKKKYI